MDGWYVSIDGVSDDTLKFLGYNLVKENDDYKIYNHVYTGDDQIVDKRGTPYLYVDDINDSIAIRASRVIPAPRDIP